MSDSEVRREALGPRNMTLEQEFIQNILRCLGHVLPMSTVLFFQVGNGCKLVRRDQPITCEKRRYILTPRLTRVNAAVDG